MERYILELAKFENKARKCYADPIDLNSNEFVEMMLLDGFYVIEYFRRLTLCMWVDIDDPILEVTWKKQQIINDMMLLENQLPYFVLSELYDMTKGLEERPFMVIAILSFFHMLQNPIQFHYSIVDRTCDRLKIKHLLHLLHVFCCPLSELTSLRENTRYDNFDADFNQTRNVVDLQEHGVKFEKQVGRFSMTTNRDATTIFDITFNNGFMKVPCIVVEYSTDTFLRNLIAYEQHSSDVRPQYFTDFALFMSQLINSKKDVELLCAKGIIVNLLGDDTEVSYLFNRLRQGIVGTSNFYYSEVCNKLNEHCQLTWNQIKVTPRWNYFNRPWAIVSTVAACVLLLLTAAQTVAAYISL